MKQTANFKDFLIDLLYQNRQETLERQLDLIPEYRQANTGASKCFDRLMAFSQKKEYQDTLNDLESFSSEESAITEREIYQQGFLDGLRLGKL